MKRTILRTVCGSLVFVLVFVLGTWHLDQGIGHELSMIAWALGLDDQGNGDYDSEYDYGRASHETEERAPQEEDQIESEQIDDVKERFDKIVVQIASNKFIRIYTVNDHWNDFSREEKILLANILDVINRPEGLRPQVRDQLGKVLVSR